MLHLASLHDLLEQVLDLPELHTAALITVAGDLISYASTDEKPYSDIRVVAGLSSEAWKELAHKDEGMIDSELGRILVLPIDDKAKQETGYENQPLLLLCLNSTETISWGELRTKGEAFCNELAKPLGKFRENLVPQPKAASSTTSPPAR